jgi:LPXTG-motif cell wall-anchored protein
MRKLFAILVACVLLMTCAVSATALDGQVIYAEGAEKFFFLPGADYSPTDLFPEFKDVMPGDTLQQKILVKNDISNDCKIKIYMRALGAHKDSVEFLSQLHLTVAKGTDTVMFDAPADQTAQLTDWVYLGTLYSGGECELIVTLDVPVTLDNQFKNLVGYLDWEFAVEELPVEPGDPEPPKTGDDNPILLWITLMAGSLTMLIILLIGRKKKEKD